jgi:endo-alpha-1,4-polygalactosaminidase (GH114 family)
MILLIALMLLATPLWANDICFTEDQGKQMIIEIEKGRMCETQVILLEAGQKELIQQNGLLNKQVKMEKSKFEETVLQLETERTICAEKDKARLEEIKAAGKPQWTMLFGGFGAGALLIGALVLLL